MKNVDRERLERSSLAFHTSALPVMLLASIIAEGESKPFPAFVVPPFV